MGVDAGNGAFLTSTGTPQLRVLRRRRIVVEVPCLGRPKNRDCRCSQTESEISEKEGMSGCAVYLHRMECRTSATLAGV
jgi:hypothetical protein